jgi:hypothetical protein
MKPQKKNKSKKIDLLKISDVEKIQVIRKLKEELREKAVEAKLWQSLLNTDDLIINGKTIHCGDKYQLTGLSLFRE